MAKQYVVSHVDEEREKVDRIHGNESPILVCALPVPLDEGGNSEIMIRNTSGNGIA